MGKRDCTLQDTRCFLAVGALGCFHFLPPVNTASVTKEVLPSQEHNNHTFAYLPSSGIAGSYSSFVFIYLS